MKKYILLAATILACSGVWAEVAQDSSIDDAMRRLNAAMLAGDAQKLRDLTADSLSYGHSDGRIQNQGEFIDALASGKTHFNRIDFSNSVTKISGDNAVIRNHFSGTLAAAGKLTETEFDVLMVWQKQQGIWKLIARQGYKH